MEADDCSFVGVDRDESMALLETSRFQDAEDSLGGRDQPLSVLLIHDSELHGVVDDCAHDGVLARAHELSGGSLLGRLGRRRLGLLLRFRGE